MRHDIDSYDQDDEDQDDAWLDGPVVKVKGKSRLRSEGPCGREGLGLSPSRRACERGIQAFSRR
jgi:hypothetical protein